MLRYIGLIWDESNPRQCEAANRILKSAEACLPEMALIACGPGAAVLCAAPKRALLRVCLAPIDGQAGFVVVLGRLFSRSTSTRGSCIVDLEESDGHEIMETRGLSLAQRFWGRYVALIHDRRARSTCIMLDPTAGVCCFTTSLDEVQIVFADVDDCAALGCHEFTINWRYVAAHLLKPFPEGFETGIEQIHRVRAGECVEFRSGRVYRRVFHWNPVATASTNLIEDPQVAASMALTTVQDSVDAWARCAQRVLHKLSGGLDSSIVLECLRSSPSRPVITCLHYFDRSATGDERQFARLAIQGTDSPTRPKCALIECERDPSEVRHESLIGVRRVPCPTFYNASLCSWKPDVAAARSHDATLFHGAFGDQLFYRNHRFAAIDYAWQHGLRPPVLPLTLSVAAANHVTFWRTLRDTFVQGRLKRKSHQDTSRVPLRFASASVIDAIGAEPSYYLRPWWYELSESLPPGKRDHMKGACLTSNTFNVLENEGDPDVIYPLGSQPLIELFLRIPTYILTAGGCDRSVVRHAFRGRVPAQILSRRSKGVTGTFASAILRNNEAFVREHLLEGVLVQHQLIQRDQIETFLSSPYDHHTPGLAVLLEFHLNLEIWLTSWTRGQRLRVAA